MSTENPAKTAGRKQDAEARAKLMAIFKADPKTKPATAAQQAKCGLGLAYEVRRSFQSQTDSPAA